MFGYHDSEVCYTDFWISDDAIQNKAFSGFAKHISELNDIVDKIVEEYRCGNYHFQIDIDDNLSDEDYEYIQREVQKRA